MELSSNWHCLVISTPTLEWSLEFIFLFLVISSISAPYFYVCDVAHLKGNLAAVGFLKYKWKYSEKVKKTIRIFDLFSIVKFEYRDQFW